MKTLLLIPLAFVVPKAVLVTGYILLKVYDKQRTKIRVIQWQRFFGGDQIGRSHRPQSVRQSLNQS